MTRRSVVLTVLVLSLATASAWSQTSPPAGGELPPGHPPMGGGRGGMPPGHPAIGGVPTSEPDVKGSLVIRAVQGTKDGPAVKGDPVTVELYKRNNSAPKKIESKLDDRGVAILDDLQIGSGVQPLVTVTHAGVAYRQVGQPMEPDHADGQVKVTVHETTDTPPPWTIYMRHVMIFRASDEQGGGLYVQDVIMVDNPTDRTWLGKPDAGGGHTILTVSLPSAGKIDIQPYVGFDSGCTRFEKGELAITCPLLPGKAQYQYGYAVPVKGGKAEVAIKAPAAIEQMSLVVPEDLAKLAKVKGLEAGQTVDMGGQQKMTIYKAAAVAAGAQVAVDFSGVKAPAPAAPPATPPGKKGSSAAGTGAQTLAAIGGGVILVGGLAFLLLKAPRHSARGGKEA